MSKVQCLQIGAHSEALLDVRLPHVPQPVLLQRQMLYNGLGLADRPPRHLVVAQIGEREKAQRVAQTRVHAHVFAGGFRSFVAESSSELELFEPPSAHALFPFNAAHAAPLAQHAARLFVQIHFGDLRHDRLLFLLPPRLALLAPLSPLFTPPRAPPAPFCRQHHRTRVGFDPGGVRFLPCPRFVVGIVAACPAVAAANTVAVLTAAAVVRLCLFALLALTVMLLFALLSLAADLRALATFLAHERAL